jgi:hypothetical protein
MGGFFSTSSAHTFYPVINPNDLNTNKDNILETLNLSNEKDALILEYAKTGKYPDNFFRFSPPSFTENSLYNLRLKFTDEETGKKMYTATVRKLTVRVKNQKFVLRDFNIKINDKTFAVPPSLFRSQQGY